MGAGVSNWRLARSVSRLGHLGVVSGTALDTILVRRLQDGDLDGAMRRALARFPIPDIADRILAKYFIPGGKRPDRPYLSLPLYTLDPSVELQQVSVAANFVEVSLAKEGHAGVVGLNLLEKIQMQSLTALYGAMLAGVDYVIMGAGIPRAFPAIIDALTEHKDVSMPAHLDGQAPDETLRVCLQPAEVLGVTLPKLKRPKFIPIVASNVLALTLARKASGKVDGFIVEGPTAGGHNAPPRGESKFNEKGEPLYGAKDEVDLGAIQKLGLPFWLAGGYGRPDKLKESLALGATGIQVGTAFAYCRESGLTADLKRWILEKAQLGVAAIFTDPLASPTGFPFKVVQVPGTQSDPVEYAARKRNCNLGYLRLPYKKADGTVGYRCRSDEPGNYADQEGDAKDAEGRKCLCNGLVANIGMPQVYPNGYLEQPLVTSGDDLPLITGFLPKGRSIYTAGDVVRNLMGLLKGARSPLGTA